MIAGDCVNWFRKSHSPDLRCSHDVFNRSR